MSKKYTFIFLTLSKILNTFRVSDPPHPEMKKYKLLRTQYLQSGVVRTPHSEQPLKSMCCVSMNNNTFSLKIINQERNRDQKLFFWYLKNTMIYYWENQHSKTGRKGLAESKKCSTVIMGNDTMEKPKLLPHHNGSIHILFSNSL